MTAAAVPMANIVFAYFFNLFRLDTALFVIKQAAVPQTASPFELFT